MLLRCLPLLLLLLLPATAHSSLQKFGWDGSLIFVGGIGNVRLDGIGVSTLDGPGLQLDTIRFDGGMTGTVTIPLTDPEHATLVTMKFENLELGAGTLTGTGTLPLKGTLKLCWFFPGCVAFGTVPLTQSGTRGIGLGGTVTVEGFQLVGAPWAVGAVQLTRTESGEPSQYTARGHAFGPDRVQGTTNQPGGDLEHVTPYIIRSPLGVHAGVIGKRIQFKLVPEPSKTTLLFCGIAGLGLLWRLRR